ncbi:MAG TPA: DEAD/DEAH box helicase [Bacillota bacterium]|nr:DEAD/DEAH box helicase [Bacillota bacterium]
MLAPKYYLYMATGPGLAPKIELSSNPRVDATWLEQSGYQDMTVYYPPQPLWIAETVLQELKKHRVLQILRFFKIIKVVIQERNGFCYGQLQTHQIADFKMPLPDLTELEMAFRGRCLLGSELPEVIREAGYAVPWNPEDWMQQLYLEGRLHRLAAVGYDQFLGVPECRRCGATDGIYEVSCLFCGDPHCLTCTHCQSMGLAKSCVPLYYYPYPQNLPQAEAIQPVLEFELTPPQQRASQALLRFLESGKRRFLVWAVCGGGKTEVCFSAVARVLAGGGRVMVAIPRKDVVTELQPRFVKAFPTVPCHALFGGAPERWSNARLVLATTHQCLRFYQSFDLIVLDEADAFPYQGSPILPYAVERALKPTGQLVVMTATPDRGLISQALNGKLPYVSIPARYHRQPLILPRIYKQKFQPFHSPPWEVPTAIQQQLLEAHSRQRKVLVFLPTIRLIETVGHEIIQWGMTQGLSGSLTHAKCNNSSMVKELLKRGQLDFVITSTVAERGITIPDLDVAVLFADNELVFDCRTLVQISGRTGRKGEAAAVVFYATRISRAMQECCRWIEQMNSEARKLGYLDSVD